MKDLFLDVLVRAKKRFKFRIENFCVMGNHIHLMIRPDSEASLSRIMQWILSVFAMSFNRSHGFTGHVWGNRFFSRIMNNLREYIRVFLYIDENPKEADIVEIPDTWNYGGIWHYQHGCNAILDKPNAFIKLVFPQHGVLQLGSELNC